MSTPREDLERLIRAIGGGFHPDTRGGDYTSLPDGWTAEEVDYTIDSAIAAGLDPYAISCEILDGDDDCPPVDMHADGCPADTGAGPCRCDGWQGYR